MFNFFKRKHKDESLEEQKADVSKYPEQLSKQCLEGLDCDQILNAKGSFGQEVTNPIPVNGPLGEIKYVGRLGTKKKGIGYIFHRLGSITMATLQGPVDVFEVVSTDGKEWDVLYIHMYHPRRSTKVPEGYRFNDFDELLSRLPIGYGTWDLDHDFPFNIGRFIERDYDIFGTGIMNKRLAKHYEEIIKDREKFVRPETHKAKIAIVRPQLNATAYFQVKI